MPTSVNTIHKGTSLGKLTTLTVEFTRPSNTSLYAAGDIINTATNATSLIELDFTQVVDATTKEIMPSRMLQIVAVSVISSHGAANPKLNPVVKLFNTATITDQDLGDNVAFNPTYAEVGTNKKLVAHIDGIQTSIGLGTETNYYGFKREDMAMLAQLNASGKLYLALLAGNNYTPSGADKFTISIKGYLL